MSYLLLIVPAFALGATVVCAINKVRSGASARGALSRQLVSFVIIGVLCCGLSLAVSAASDDSSVSSPAEASEATETVSSGGDLSKGMGLIAAAVVTGLSGIGGGIAVAAGAPAAIGATSEDPKAFGKALIFVALGEGIALYGLLVSILILAKV